MKKLSIKILLIGCLGVLFTTLQVKGFSTLTCDAYFTYEDYQGPNPVSGGVTFLNESTGSYTNGSWDFGDGNFFSAVSNDPIDHFYASDGVYNVCLTIWDDTNCMSTFCSDVIVGNLVDICAQTDCVFPGDFRGESRTV